MSILIVLLASVFGILYGLATLVAIEFWPGWLLAMALVVVVGVRLRSPAGCAARCWHRSRDRIRGDLAALADRGSAAVSATILRIWPVGRTGEPVGSVVPRAAYRPRRRDHVATRPVLPPKAGGSRLGRARPRDRRATDLHRRDETHDGPHTVRAPPVPGQALRAEELDAREEVERAHRVADVRQRAGDAALLDEEGAVASGAGQRGGARIGRVRVMEARDEHSASDRADELVARPPSAGHREFPGVTARLIARFVGGVAGRTGPHRLRGMAVVHRSLRDTPLDEDHALLRRAFVVEGDRQRPWIERVVGQREAIARHLLADPT